MNETMTPTTLAGPGPDLAQLNLVQLLSHVHEAGIELWSEDGQLRFSAPRGALSGELRDELVRRKADLVDFLVRARAGDDGLPPIEPLPPGSPAPLSFGQERLWFFDQYERDSAAYNMYQAVRLRGPLSVATLSRAVDEVVRRHAVLRSRFPASGGQPRQQVEPAAPVPLPRIDLSGLADAPRRRAVRRAMVAERLRPFDLERGPVFRVRCLRLAADEHVVLFNFHHIASDGWSIGVFIRELLACYRAFRDGLPSPLPEPAVQYADYAAWERAHLDGPVLAADVDWWRRELADLPPVLELPLDHPQRRESAREGTELRRPLPAALTAAVSDLARRREATPFMVFMAALQALLHRYTGQRNVAVGTPVAGRHRPEIEDLIGIFINTLVVRGRPHGDRSFADLLDEVRRASLGAFAHQRVPFEKLVEVLQPERGGGHTPIFQVLYAYQNVALPALELPGLAAETLPGVGSQMLFDLTLNVWEERHGTDLSWSYRRALFDATTVERLAGHFERLLAAALAAPERPLGDLPMLSAAERRQLVAELNDVAPSYPRQASIPRLFAETARRLPDSEAVRYGSRSLTYAELERRSRRLAARLAAAGLRRGGLVGVAVERSPELVVAMLAVLRAGGAYLPFDADYPEERLAAMLADSAAPVVLVRGELGARVAALAGRAGSVTLDLDTDDGGDTDDAVGGAADGDAGGWSEPPTCGDDLAYVIYTSGSTGRPKGVAVPHRGVVRLVRGTDYLQLWPEARVAQASNASFDAATFEVWGALLNGGAVVGMGREEALTPRRMALFLRRERIDAMFLTTALFNQVARHEPTAFAGLDTLIVGGEALDPEWIRRVLGEEPPRRLLNGYGPTESTTFAAWKRIGALAADAVSVPIGRPIANTTLHVVDRRLRPVPLGVLGELMIGGDGLAAGYLARPALTAERFVPDPFGGEPGARLYRTGDLVRRLGDGEVDFVGRSDHQVKVRGFRIELGEVEAALAALPDVDQAVVLVRGGDADSRRLAAFVTAPAGAEPDPAALRAALAERLPDYMVPASVAVLDALPLTPNGKLDRRALEALEPRRDAAPGEDLVAAPSGPAEELVAGIWCEVLGLERIGRHDDFFTLGGHSLLATQVASRVREAFGVDLELASFFAAPTVADLVREVESAAQASPAPPLVPLSRARRAAGGLPLSFAQQRLWFLDRLVPDSPAYNIPSALRLDGPLAAAALRRAFDHLVRRHEALRTRFRDTPAGPLQEIVPWDPESPVPLPVHDLSALPAARREGEVRRLAAVEAARPFRLLTGPLLRVRLLRLDAGGGAHVLLVTMHHIVSDGWSAGVLVRELEQLYGALAAGAAPELEPLPVQYADFAAWQRDWLRGERLDQEVELWRRMLAGAPPLTDLPTDRPRPGVQSFAGASLPVALDAALAQRVRAAARRFDATPFLVLLAAFTSVLSRWTSQDDLVVGSPVAGRNRREIEGLIGFFVNTLALRTDLSGAPGLGKVVARARTSFLTAHAHQDLPFERLVEMLAPERDPSYAPVFQTAFALQTAPQRDPEVAGLTFTTLEVPSRSAKFDLTLALRETPDGRYAGSLEYATALFDASTVRRLLGHLATLLAAGLDEPERPVADLPLLSAVERRQLLAEWAAGAAAAGDPAPVPLQVAARAAEDAAAPALVAGGETVSYGELAASAAALAQRLRRLGVGAETPVAVWAERSPRQVAALLAVMAAGGAYVPLDPDFPEERVRFVLADCGAALLLADAATAARRPPDGPPVLRLDEPRTWQPEGGGVPDLAAVAPVLPEQLAYVVYTSGSTGTPKGAGVSHANLAGLVAWYRGFVGHGPGRRTAHLAGLAFDASVWELWPSLACGTAVHLVPEAVRSEPERLRDWIVSSGLHFAFVPTPMAELLVEHDWPAAAPLEWLLCGGDRLHHAPPPGRPFVLVNAYGPTECTVVATAGAVEPAARPRARAAAAAPPLRPHLGRPIAGSRVHFVDRRLRLVPAGVAGELCVGGANVGRGYLGRPALTAAAFVPDPFATEPGARLYRTGDLARWRGDGRVDFLGRIDGQVKLRGFRIELGEVEAALSALREVGEAAVLVAGEGTARRLVAFVSAAVMGRGDVLEEGNLRAALARRLPDYMVPSTFVTLAELPRNASGKVDRGALAAQVPQAGEGIGEPPSGAAEEKMAEIWRDLLGVRRVFRGDDFFALGGHSLLATQVVGRIRESFGIELELASLFTATTLASMTSLAEALRPEAGPAAAPPLVPLPPRRRAAGDLPLSFAQQRLWFLDRLEPGQTAYNMPFPFRLRGRLDAARLARALTRVVRRQESLRTTFRELDGRPRQVVAPPPAAAPRLPLADLSHLAPERREAEARRLAAAEAGLPFDLERGPLLRAALLRLADDDHAFLLDMHHIVSDGWSIGVLVRDFQAFYEADAGEREAGLAPLGVQYADFAAWQRDWLQGEVLEAELEHWRRRLAGAPPVLELPLDRPRPPLQSYRGGERRVSLPAALSRRLDEHAQRHGATPFMVLLAAFAATLCRWSGQRSAVVGTPAAGRTEEAVEGLIGFFVNTLALHVDLAGRPGFGDLVERCTEVALEAFEHQEVPFERLVEELVPGRDLAVPPLFQAMLSLQNTRRGDLRLPGLVMEPLGVEGSTSKFDLLLALEERDGAYAGSLEYARDLFDAATADRLAAHFRRLLAAGLEDPRRPFDELDVLSPEERHELLYGWNLGDGWNESPEPGGAPTLHGRVRARAARTPDETALVAGGETLSYGELVRRAAALAAHLRRRGVGPEVRVGVAMQRGADLVAALLAVLDAGGAYVPLDPAYPAQRLAFMVEDAGAVLVLTDGATTLPELPAPVLALSPALFAPPAGEAEAVPAAAPAAGHLAYVIYTSGSTGRPKGVAIEHRSAVALLDWAGATFSAEELSGVLAATSVSFDLSVFEIFAPLAHGGRVILARDVLALPELPARGEVRLVNTVPSALGELLALGALPPSVTTVCLAGEALPGALVDAAHAAGGHVERVWNLYGPSEDTTYSTGTLCRSGGGEPTIGRPLPGTRAYVLDRRLEPVPVGVVGELLLGGDGLARGYLGRPARTAESFVPDRFGGEPGGRLYRTGDLVRRRHDGELLFLGRADHQVKVRGFRIELGEVEAALRRLDGVREAVVLARDGRLVAWVAADAEPERLSAELSSRLPAHMVPSLWVSLEALPHTPSGKVDRRALPAPQAGAGAGRRPAGLAEELVAAAFADVLELPEVAADDDFFALGGHSLLATRVVSRLRRTFGVELSVRALFETPTVATLARRAEALHRDESRRQGGRALPPPLVPQIDEPRLGRELPVSFAQQRLWFLDALEPGSPAYNVPVAYRVRGGLDAARLRRVMTRIVERHESLRTVFRVTDGQPAQVVTAPFVPALPVHELGALPAGRREEEARLRATAEAMRPFDLAAGPLLRLALYRLGGDDSLLLINLHHIVSDGWSVDVLVREVRELYAADLEGRDADLPPLPVQYPDFAVWQRGWLDEAALAAEIEFWRRQLAGAPPVLELPTDRPRPAMHSFRGGLERAALPAELSARLRAFARAQGATPFMVLLAAFAGVLSRWSGQRDVVVGTPVAGRTDSAVEGLIGFFVNTLVLRADLRPAEAGGAPGFGALVARLREVALDAFEHQEVPFERLVDELAPSRDLAVPPLFQAMLILQSAGGGDLSLPGVELRPVGLETASSKFDLTLSFEERDGSFAGYLEYSTDLFDAATMARFADHVRRLLAAGMERPERPVEALDFVSAEERRQLLHAWNERGTAEVAGRTLDGLVRRRAAAAPQRTALVAGEVTLTYGELAARAAALAGRLRRAGVGPEVRVGVAMRRSADLVVALLAVLEAGGAYVPLDPAYPAERLAFMVEDSGAVLVLAGGAALPALPARVLRVDGVAAAGADGAAAAPPPPEEPGAERRLAYVIYTSGSTGRPKGVAIEHRSAVALMDWAGAAYDAGELSGVLAATSVSFDLSVFEIFAPLAHGGRVLLVDDVLALPELAAGAAGGGVRLVNTVPSAMTELLRLGALPPSVTTVCLAGEPLPGALVEALYAGASGLRRVDNLYGPSEDTTYSTGAACAPGAGEPTIGLPLPGSRAYVLDRLGQPAPLGVAGELHLGGAGLARGYLGRPARTAAAFVPDPWSGEPGARLYRTGDLVRRRRDGELLFLGRADHQVKVRGFRIELGEIETALRRHPAVREAAVAVHDGRLAAYWSPADGQPEAGEEALRAAVGERLPAHMVPSLWMRLDALPRTPSGKVDRRALPAPESAAAAAGRAPEGAVEERLAAIFREVLALPEIGAEEDFFTRGGHSLLATRVVSRVQEAFGVELPVRALFETPTVASLGRRLGAGGAETAAAPAAEAVALVRLPAAERAAGLPLSFEQQRFWFLYLLLPGSAAYNVPLALRLGGRLDPAALEAALGALVARHEVLRTAFEQVGEEPVQRVLPPRRQPLCRTDLSALPAARRRAEARRVAAAEARRPFDLGAGRPLRSRLVGLDGGEHVLLLTLHHIVTDGWSLGVLVRETVALYAALARHPLPPAAAAAAAGLAELPVQYGDFAAWQRGWLRGEVLDAEIEYWRGQLAGAPPLLELPTDRPRPAVRSMRGGTVPVSLPPAVAGAVEAAARTAGATPFMALLALWSALLCRWSGQREVVVGTPVAGRPRRELEPLVGCFVNTLALRLAVAPEASFRDLLAASREVSLDAFAHQQVPFERLVDALAPERDLSHSPLFQAMLVLQNAPGGGGFGASELAVETVEEDGTGTTKFDLTLFLTAAGGAVSGVLEYDRDLFDVATARRLAAGFESLAAAAVAAPGRAVSRLGLLSPAEERGLLEEWNRSGAWPSAEDVADGDPVAAFVRRAAAAPGLPAVTGADGGFGTGLDFAALDRASGVLARRLAARGVGPDVPVAVRLRRGPDLVVAVLAVLRAGGAYVPVDPAYPLERAAYMLEQSGAKLLIADAAMAEGLVRDGGPIRRVDPAEAAAPGVEPLPPRSADPRQLAYVIYTSGSTGRPKGVMVDRGSLAAYLRRAVELYVSAGDGGVPLHSSIGFDLTVTSLFAPLMAGRPVLLVPDGGDLEALADALRGAGDGGGTAFVKLTPAHLEVMTHLLRDGDRPDAWTGALVLGGEQLTAELVTAWRRRAPRVRLLNEYGPTETVVGCCLYEVPAGELAPGPLPIGRPMPQSRLYVLDRHLRPAVPGAVGEIYIGGEAVARGYLAQPARTAAAFVPDPFGGEPGARLYRSGDLARLRPDGELAFLGRADHQVKVRGYRIELAEIEAVLEEEPEVAEAVVLARRDEDTGEARLVAYVVPHGGAGGGLAAGLAAAASRRLPEYMLPAAWVVLEALPLTVHGKVDRGALPAPDRTVQRGGAAYVPPRTRVELELQRIWEEVLKVSPVGVTDDFFEIGGHSLLGIYLIACVRDRMGYDLPVPILFRASTIEGLAAVIEEAEERGEVRATHHPALVPLVPDGDRPPLFCVHGAGGNVFHFAVLSRLLRDEQPGRPFYGLQSPGLVPGGEAPRTVEEMAATYVDAVRSVQPSGPYFLAGYSMGGLVAYEMARRLVAAGEEVALLALFDARTDPGDVEELDTVELLTYFAGELLIPLAPDELAGLDADEALAYLLEKGWDMEKIPREFRLDDAKRYLDVMEQTLRAAERFTAREPYPGRVVVLRAADGLPGAPDLGWDALAAGGADVREVPGDHRTLFTLPHVETVVRQLAAAIADAAATDGPPHAVPAPSEHTGADAR